MPDAGKLSAQAARQARQEDKASAAFARQLPGVATRALARLLAWLQTEQPTTPETVRAVLRESGYDLAVVTSANRMQTREGATRRFVAAWELMTRDLLGQGDVVARVVWRQVALASLGRLRPMRVIRLIARTMDVELSRAATLFDTQVSILGRQVEAQAETPADAAPLYIYLGPIDDKTREWCLSRVGRVYSRPEIDAMVNGQLPNPFLSGGGYNCRHRWIQLAESSELRELAGTTQRADDIQSDVDAAASRRKKAS